ncbi:hypothetical protein Dimus_011582 [Dionaea muscipula]
MDVDGGIGGGGTHPNDGGESNRTPVKRRSHREQAKHKIELVTVFICNLPEDMDEIWLMQLFRKHGEVHDVFIPQKRTAKTNYRFGFVRFSSKTEALASIQELLHGMTIRDACLAVKLAKYNRQITRNGSWARPQLKKKWVPINTPTGTRRRAPSSGSGGLTRKETSYVDAVRGTAPRQTIPDIPIIKGACVGNGWLYRSAVATFKDDTSLGASFNCFTKEDRGIVDTRQLGNKQVLITFQSLDLLNQAPEDKQRWLERRFHSFNPWSVDTLDSFGREVWLSCFGYSCTRGTRLLS